MKAKYKIVASKDTIYNYLLWEFGEPVAKKKMELIVEKHNSFMYVVPYEMWGFRVPFGRRSRKYHYDQMVSLINQAQAFMCGKFGKIGFGCDAVVVKCDVEIKGVDK